MKNTKNARNSLTALYLYGFFAMDDNAKYEKSLNKYLSKSHISLWLV
jgi:hypothetical protein